MDCIDAPATVRHGYKLKDIEHVRPRRYHQSNQAFHDLRLDVQFRFNSAVNVVSSDMALRNITFDSEIPFHVLGDVVCVPAPTPPPPPTRHALQMRITAHRSASASLSRLARFTRT